MLPIFVTNFKRGDAGGVEVMTEERKLFDELMEGIDAMQQQREGKITLRSKEVCRISARLRIRDAHVVVRKNKTVYRIVFR